MLQIITGKFFRSEEMYKTQQRGVLYSNYQMRHLEKIETAVGTLLTTTTWDDVSSLVYEVEEKLEKYHKDGSRAGLMAVGLDYLLEDFSAVVSFALNVTCTPDLSLTYRLTQAQHPSLNIPKLPKEYVGRVFDKQITAASDDVSRLMDFVNNLVGLNRKTYKAVIRAIRRYVSGLHRISDELDLAYTLLVASIESLAQDFSTFTPTWENYEEKKRKNLDKALDGASEEIVQRVRNTILDQEHVALRKRFQEFSLAHVGSSFFREEANLEARPIRSSDLPELLKSAYQLRSSYVHQLIELPRNLTAIPLLHNYLEIDGRPILSFHGIARLARHIIFEFVARAPKSDKEDFDWRSDLPNTVRVPISERYFIGNPAGYNSNTARTYLSGFLSQLTSMLTHERNFLFTDIRPVLQAIEVQVDGLKKPEQRLPMLALYLLFHFHVPASNQMPNAQAFIDAHDKELDTPSIESMVCHVLLEPTPQWSSKELEELRKQYSEQRYHKNGLSFGPLIETTVTLYLAESYRLEGNEERARQLINEAVDNLPGHQQLLQFEQATVTGTLPTVKWDDILLPPRSETVQQSITQEEAETAEVQQEEKVAEEVQQSTTL